MGVLETHFWIINVTAVLLISQVAWFLGQPLWALHLSVLLVCNTFAYVIFSAASGYGAPLFLGVAVASSTFGWFWLMAALFIPRMPKAWSTTARVAAGLFTALGVAIILAVGGALLHIIFY